MADPAATILVPRPTAGRLFTGRIRVRVGDADARARLRLDAMARALQDLAADDNADARGATGDLWVVRRSVFDVVARPVLEEEVELVTWASGTGSRWAERRISFVGDRGGRVEGASLWVAVDRTGQPRLLTEAFLEMCREAAGGRRVSSRLTHDPGLPDGEAVDRRTFSVRVSDLDLLGHVNNAIGWAMVEEVLEGSAVRRPFRAEIEYRAPIEPATDLELVTATDEGGIRLWGVDRGAGTVLLTARVVGLPR